MYVSFSAVPEDIDSLGRRRFLIFLQIRFVLKIPLVDVHSVVLSVVVLHDLDQTHHTVPGVIITRGVAVTVSMSL